MLVVLLLLLLLVMVEADATVVLCYRRPLLQMQHMFLQHSSQPGAGAQRRNLRSL